MVTLESTVNLIEVEIPSDQIPHRGRQVSQFERVTPFDVNASHLSCAPYTVNVRRRTMAGRSLSSASVPDYQQPLPLYSYSCTITSLSHLSAGASRIGRSFILTDSRNFNFFRINSEIINTEGIIYLYILLIILLHNDTFIVLTIFILIISIFLYK